MIPDTGIAETEHRGARGRLPCGAPNPVDLHFGQRLRRRRLLAGMSQQQLAKALGLTAQQIQKYECAANRAAASLLWNLSRALDCPVSLFFEGMPPTTKAHSPRRLIDRENVVSAAEPPRSDGGAEREILNLTRAFRAISGDSIRSNLLGLVRDLAAQQPHDQSAANSA